MEFIVYYGKESSYNDFCISSDNYCPATPIDIQIKVIRPSRES